MADIDLTTMTDPDLDQLRRAVIVEQETRAVRANATARVESVVRKVASAGCVESEIRQAVETGLTKTSDEQEG